MSLIKVNKIENTSTSAGGVEIDSSGHVQIDGRQIPTTGALSNRNLVVNGGMTVWQRGTASASVVNAFLADRFQDIQSSDGAMTHEQSTDAPDGFAYSLKLNVTTADTSVGSNQYVEIDYNIEAQDCYRLKYGSNAAEKFTLSFWVKSSKTGTYCVQFQKRTNTRFVYVKEFTINTANTWEKKTITVAPDSNITGSAGAIVNNNEIGIRIVWCLMMGSTYSGATDGVWTSNTNHFATSNSVNWMDSTSNDFYLTGVQLEAGEKSTEFEHEPYSVTLDKCQRYYYQMPSDGASYQPQTTDTYSRMQMVHPTTMRANPTVTATGWTLSGTTHTITGYADTTGNRTFPAITVSAEL